MILNGPKGGGGKVCACERERELQINCEDVRMYCKFLVCFHLLPSAVFFFLSRKIINIFFIFIQDLLVSFNVL